MSVEMAYINKHPQRKGSQVYNVIVTCVKAIVDAKYCNRSAGTKFGPLTLFEYGASLLIIKVS